MSIEDDFARIIEDMDELFADPSLIPTWYLSSESVKSATVVLGGDGGDELFAGYKRYQKHVRSVWRGDFKIPFLTLSGWRPKGWKKTLSEASMGWIDSYSLRFSGFTPNQRKFLQPGFDIANHYWRATLDNKENNPIKQLLEIDMNNYLPEYILRKSDLCTMAVSTELTPLTGLNSVLTNLSSTGGKKIRFITG